MNWNTYCIPFCFSTEQNRTNRVDWVRLGSVIELHRTHQKAPVRLCSIAEPDRTPIERLGLIGFWFGFVRLTTLGEKYNPHLFCSRSERKIRLMIWGCICYDGAGTQTAVEGNITSAKCIQELMASSCLVFWRKRIIVHGWQCACSKSPHYGTP